MTPLAKERQACEQWPSVIRIDRTHRAGLQVWAACVVPRAGGSRGSMPLVTVQRQTGPRHHSGQRGAYLSRCLHAINSLSLFLSHLASGSARRTDRSRARRPSASRRHHHVGERSHLTDELLGEVPLGNRRRNTPQALRARRAPSSVSPEAAVSQTEPLELSVSVR